VAGRLLVRNPEGMATVEAILRSVRSASPAPGMSTSVVALDGYGGAGKSTLADYLGAVLRAEGRRVDLVHTDDFASADNPLNWWPRLIDQVLQPLREAATARYQRYDWDLGKLAEWHEIQPEGLVLLEGVSASRNVFRPYLSLSVWIETPADERLRRGLERDGEQARDQWQQWMSDEIAWGNAERPWERADIVISGISGEGLSAPDVPGSPEMMIGNGTRPSSGSTSTQEATQ
jgi:uridine kinase